MCEWKNQNFLKPLQVSHKSFSISCAISVSKPLLLSNTQLFVSFLICIHHGSNQMLVFLEYQMTLMALCSLTWSVNWIVQAQAICALWVTRIRLRGIWGRPELSKYSPSLKYDCSPHVGPQVHWEVRATGKAFWCFGNCRTFKAQLTPQNKADFQILPLFCKWHHPRSWRICLYVKLPLLFLLQTWFLRLKSHDFRWKEF